MAISPDEVAHWKRRAEVAEGKREKLHQQRDRFAALLVLADRLARAAPDTEIKADDGEVVDGSWLSAAIQDALWDATDSQEDSGLVPETVMTPTKEREDGTPRGRRARSEG